MAPRRDFYALRMMNIIDRLKLSKTAQEILRSLDEYEKGIIDEAELGRQVRLSPIKRLAVTDTISKCATVMKKDPNQLRDCVEIIESCTQILSIADTTKPEARTFPFMKLPPEIRERVFLMSIGWPRVAIYPIKKATCPCARQESAPYTWPRKLNLGIAIASRILHDEMMVFLYKHYIIDFACTCELLAQLKSTPELRGNLRRAKVHWVGKDARDAFVELGKCNELRELTIVISRKTTSEVTPREKEMQKYFSISKNRLTDALGIDELLEIRGLQYVNVQHPHIRLTDRRTTDEKFSLCNLLRSRLLLPKE